MAKMSVNQRGEDDNMLSRWARRKQAVQGEEQEAAEAAEVAEAPEEKPEPETEEEALAQLAEDEPELAEELAAIDIDSLTYDDDFSVFMKDKVPAFIKRRALSKLWLSNPILANLDGLNEYDEDYTQASNAAEMVAKAFEDARKREEAKAKAEAAKQQAAKAGEDKPSEDAEDETEIAEADTEADDLVEDDDGDLEA